MTVTNGHQNAHGESADRSVENILDELLEALRSDQGGARTEALKRALGQGATTGGDNRDGDLEETVNQLAADVAAVEAMSDSTGPGAVRSELDTAANERKTLKSAVRSLQTTTNDVEDRIDTLEDAVSELDERHEAVAVSAREIRSELAAVRKSLDTAATEPEEPASTTDDSDVAERIDHLETILNTRTSALAAKAKRIEAVEERIDELETSVDERTSTLESELADVNSTLEEAATFLQSETRDELEDVQATLEEQIDTLESTFRSEIQSLEEDVDTLEWHAVDMIQWRKSFDDSAVEKERIDEDDDKWSIL